MNANELTEKVLSAVKGNDQAIKEVSSAILSRDESRIRQVFKNHAGIEVTAEELKTVLSEFDTEDKIAACT